MHHTSPRLKTRRALDDTNRTVSCCVDGHTTVGERKPKEVSRQKSGAHDMLCDSVTQPMEQWQRRSYNAAGVAFQRPALGSRAHVSRTLKAFHSFGRHGLADGRVTDNVFVFREWNACSVRGLLRSDTQGGAPGLRPRRLPWALECNACGVVPQPFRLSLAVWKLTSQRPHSQGIGAQSMSCVQKSGHRESLSLGGRDRGVYQLKGYRGGVVLPATVPLRPPQLGRLPQLLGGLPPRHAMPPQSLADVRRCHGDRTSAGHARPAVEVPTPRFPETRRCRQRVARIRRATNR